MNTLGDNDEEEAEKQIAAREPKLQRGAAQGRRADKEPSRSSPSTSSLLA